MKNIFYIFSLVLIAIAILLLVEYPNTNRMQTIAGGLTFIGLALNIGAFVQTKKL